MTSAEPNTVLTKARKEDYLRVEHCQAFRGEWCAWSFTLDGRNKSLFKGFRILPPGVISESFWRCSHFDSPFEGMRISGQKVPRKYLSKRYQG